MGAMLVPTMPLEAEVEAVLLVSVSLALMPMVVLVAARLFRVPLKVTV